MSVYFLSASAIGCLSFCRLLVCHLCICCQIVYSLLYVCLFAVVCLLYICLPILIVYRLSSFYYLFVMCLPSTSCLFCPHVSNLPSDCVLMYACLPVISLCSYLHIFVDMLLCIHASYLRADYCFMSTISLISATCLSAVFLVFCLSVCCLSIG